MSLPLIGAKPARRVSYEPPHGISAGSFANLLVNAKTTTALAKIDATRTLVFRN